MINYTHRILSKEKNKNNQTESNEFYILYPINQKAHLMRSIVCVFLSIII